MNELSPQDQADLAALADGRLDPARRADVEARAAADPALAAALVRQRAALSAITAAAADVSAPLALRVRVETLQRPDEAPAEAGWRTRLARLRRGPGPRGARSRRARRRWLPTAGLAGTAAVALLALALVLPLGGGLTVENTLAAAERPPQFAAMVDPREEKLLRERVEQVRFPNFAGKFGWRASGARTDELEGRDTRTVFYARGRRTLAYTIVAGDALDRPDASSTVREGVELRVLREGGRTVVTWLRQGHTCVLSGEGVDEQTLLELASWKGTGAIAF